MARPRVADRFAAVSNEEDGRLCLALQALADPVRLRMVRLLAEREQCVCHLAETFGLSQGSISHHVAALKRAGLVLERRDSRWTYYRLSPEATASLQRSLGGLLDLSRSDSTPANCCGPEGECS